ncbi:MAG: NAD(P) transhydrogenase subunit alpha, partial [Verrucomicrobia bacterium]|nr:NAD(P) transhydrogenase subunit alpha [Verrucomicrobiota bacterium]
LGLEVACEAGLGAAIHAADEVYRKAGVTVSSDRSAALASADIIARLRPPDDADAQMLPAAVIHISHLDPFNRGPLIKALAAQKVSAICMELIPRSTLAQKMDALSSQASLGGYAAVMLAAQRLPKIFPMMMTPAGTIAPARVFIIGAGVAGLQAIATAKRLGARVEAFDTRPVVKEQVQSLGARFVEVDLGDTGQTKDGYAKALTDEQLALQRAAMAKHCASADVVITTAQVFGKRAPRIITAEMLKGMQPGSVVVDMAVETGGNVEGSKLNEDVDIGGVCVMGPANLPGCVPAAASQVYATNVANLIEHFWDAQTKSLRLNLDDAIMRGCLVTHDGRVVNEAVRQALGLAAD